MYIKIGHVLDPILSQQEKLLYDLKGGIPYLHS
jgi:hypothetical protein